MNFFQNWSRSDFLDFFTKEEIAQLEGLEKTKAFEFSMSSLIISYLSDFLLFNKNKQDHLIDIVIDRLNEDIVLNELQNHALRSTSRLNPYNTLKNKFKKEPCQFINFLGMGTDIRNMEIDIYNYSSINKIMTSYPIRDYQKKCCQKIEDLAKNNMARAILHLPTGAGKTRTAINYVCMFLRDNPKVIVVWLADTVELCEQALQEFSRAWSCLGDREINSFAMFNQHSFSMSGIQEGFVVAGLQKFRAKDQLEVAQVQTRLSEFKNKVGLVIFDEAHKALATTYQMLTESIIEQSEKGCFLLGLSATPGRSLYDNDENARLSNLFNNNKINMEISGFSSPIEFLQENGYLAKTNFEVINYDKAEVNFELFSVESSEVFINTVLAASVNRNLSIVKQIQSHYQNNSNSKMIVFSCSNDHSRELSVWLNALGYVAKIIDTNTDKVARANYIHRYKNGDIQILLNYGVLTAGFDAPCTDAVVVTRPTNSLVQYLQMAGRAMRGPKSNGHSACTIYTVNDDIEEYRNMFKAFDYWNNNWN